MTCWYLLWGTVCDKRGRRNVRVCFNHRRCPWPETRPIKTHKGIKTVQLGKFYQQWFYVRKEEQSLNRRRMKQTRWVFRSCGRVFNDWDIQLWFTNDYSFTAQSQLNCNWFSLGALVNKAQRRWLPRDPFCDSKWNMNYSKQKIKKPAQEIPKLYQI